MSNKATKVLVINGFKENVTKYEGDFLVDTWINPRKRVDSSFSFPVFERLYDAVVGYRRVVAEDYDLIVCSVFGVSMGRSFATRTLKWICEKVMIWQTINLSQKTRTPLAVVDVVDDLTIHPINRPLLEASTLYFKRELSLDPFHAFESFDSNPMRKVLYFYRHCPDRDAWRKKLVPIPLGVRDQETILEPKKAVEKRFDLFYCGGVSGRPRREGWDEIIQELERRGRKVFYPVEPLPFEEYLEAMRDSKLALSPPGAGWDCHRTYEAAFVGTVPVTSFPIICRWMPFRGNREALFYDTEQDLPSQLDAMLEHSEDLDQIAKEAHTLAVGYHTQAHHFQMVVETTLETWDARN